jgi:hypothetical protein
VNKRRNIEERLRHTNDRLAAAEAYVARGVNVGGRAFLHLDDWNGRSGHPLWMKNHMIPATEWRRARDERALHRVIREAKEKRRTQRRRQKAQP